MIEGQSTNRAKIKIMKANVLDTLNAESSEVNTLSNGLGSENNI
jgi:hypothetical protein